MQRLARSNGWSKASPIPTQERLSPRESSLGKEVLPIIASVVVGEVVTSGGQEGGRLSRAGGEMFGIHVQSRKSLVDGSQMGA